MRVLTNVNELPAFRNGVLTIGTFDGVHQGHQEIINHIKSTADEIGGESIILTFHPHPRLVINPNDTSLKLITTLEEKIDLLAHYGVDNLIVAPFSKAFSQISAEAYVKDFLWKNIHPKVVVIGYDHRFGNNREGGIELLQQMAPDLGFEVQEIEKQTVDNIDVSSTKVRNALLQGDIAKANTLLGHLFSVQGTVVKGAQRGRLLGYPTANIDLGNANKLVPKTGVYTVRVHHNGTILGGMMSIGFNPTFNGQEQTIEVYIFDFDQDIYGQQIKVEFLAYLRPEAKFENVEALIEQMHQDGIESKKILTYHSKTL